MNKQRIAIGIVIIFSIVIGRYLMKRVESDFKESNRSSQMMYVTDSVNVRIAPNDSAEIMYILISGDSLLISDYNADWKEVQSGGFVHSAALADPD